MSKSKNTTVKKVVEIKRKLHNFGDLPKTVQLCSDELNKLEGYVFEEKGRFWKNSKEFVCVLLTDKHI